MKTKEYLLEKVAGTGILPVIAIPSLAAAVPLARALRRGGAKAIEVTLRTPCALDAIKAIRKNVPEMDVGAGTILSPKQVADAKRAGLWGTPGPWTQYPTRMMLLRARAFAYRDAFPDVLKGIRVVEEEQDAPIDVTVSAPPYAGQLPAPADGGDEGGEGAHALPKKTSAVDIMRKAQAQKAGAERKPAEKPAEEKPAEPAPADGGDNPASVFGKGDREKVKVPAKTGELDLGK